MLRFPSGSLRRPLWRRACGGPAARDGSTTEPAGYSRRHATYRVVRHRALCIRVAILGGVAEPLFEGGVIHDAASTQSAGIKSNVYPPRRLSDGGQTSLLAALDVARMAKQRQASAGGPSVEITATPVTGTGARLCVGEVHVEVEHDFDGETLSRVLSVREDRAGPAASARQAKDASVH